MDSWQTLSLEDQLSSMKEASFVRPQLIFKHSTRCGISSMVKRRFERGVSERFTDTAQFYYLDLIKFRHVSNAIAERFNVQHESPQLILVHNGTAIYNTSHNGINAEALEQQLQVVSSNS